VNTAASGTGPEADLDPAALSRHNNREGIQLLVIFSPVVILGGLLSAWLCLKASPSTWVGSERVQFGLAALAALAMGTGGLAWAWRLHRRMAPLFEVLERVPESVVWVYARTERATHTTQLGTRMRSTHVYTTVWMAMQDGSLEWLIVPSMAAGDAVVAHVARCAPTATVGYSQDCERQFRENPASLRRPSKGNGPTPGALP
jgi:hypothetical protein